MGCYIKNLNPKDSIVFSFKCHLNTVTCQYTFSFPGFCYLFWFQYYISVILLPFLVSILYFCDFATFSCFNIIFLWFCYLFLFQYYIFVMLLPFLVSILYFCDFATFSCFNIIFLWFCYLFLFQYYIFVMLLPFLVSILYFFCAKCLIWYDFGSIFGSIHYGGFFNWAMRITHGGFFV